MSLPQERSTAEQVFYTRVARSRSESSSSSSSSSFSSFSSSSTNFPPSPFSRSARACAYSPLH